MRRKSLLCHLVCKRIVEQEIARGNKKNLIGSSLRSIRSLSLEETANGLRSGSLALKQRNLNLILFFGARVSRRIGNFLDFNELNQPLVTPLSSI